MPQRKSSPRAASARDARFLPVMDRLKHILVVVITIMMGLVLLLAVVDLTFVLGKDILSPLLPRRR